MLTREVMGLFALGVLWLNTGLILAVAFGRMRRLGALASRLRASAARGELVRGIARETPDGVFASRTIHQTGRAVTTGGPDRVLFTDGAQSFDVPGGVVEADGKRLVVSPVATGRAEVWLDARRVSEALACGSPAEFEEAWVAGSKYKGYGRDARIAVEDGAEVWVHGRLEGDTLEPFEGEPLLVSTVDPAAWASGAARHCLAFLVLATLGLLVVTGVALWPPHFGLVSTLGGALCLAYFLGIQPLGTALRDRVQTPARRLEGALWRRPEGQPAPART